MRALIKVIFIAMAIYPSNIVPMDLPWGLSNFSTNPQTPAQIFLKIDEKLKDAAEKKAKMIKALCPKQAYCRMWQGIWCGMNAKIFDVCYTVCREESGFMRSGCVKQAVIQHKFNTTTRVYRREKGSNISPIEHLIRELEPSESGPLKSAVCSMHNNFLLTPFIPLEEQENFANLCAKQKEKTTKTKKGKKKRKQEEDDDDDDDDL